MEYKIDEILEHLESLLVAHREQPSVLTLHCISTYLADIEDAAEELIIEYKEQSDDNL